MTRISPPARPPPLHWKSSIANVCGPGPMPQPPRSRRRAPSCRRRPSRAAPRTLEQRAQVYLRIGLDEAVTQQLGRPVHVIEAMTPEFIGLTPGPARARRRSQPAGGAGGVSGSRGRMILLDQQRLRTGQAPGAAAGNLRWTLGDVMLYLHGEPGRTCFGICRGGCGRKSVSGDYNSVSGDRASWLAVLAYRLRFAVPAYAVVSSTSLTFRISSSDVKRLLNECRTRSRLIPRRMTSSLV